MLSKSNKMYQKRPLTESGTPLWTRLIIFSLYFACNIIIDIISVKLRSLYYDSELDWRTVYHYNSLFEEDTFLGWLRALLVNLQQRPLLTLQSLLVRQSSPEIGSIRFNSLTSRNFLGSDFKPKLRRRAYRDLRPT